MVDFVCAFIKMLDATELELRGVGESTLRELQRAVKRRRAKDDPGNKTYIPETSAQESASY